MTKQFVSPHVIKAINKAYTNAGLPIPLNVRAHDVRGVATSLRVQVGSSLNDVMHAGHWSRPSTFFKFYQTRTPSVTGSPLHKLKYFVSASKVIKLFPFTEVKVTGVEEDKTTEATELQLPWKGTKKSQTRTKFRPKRRA